MYYDLIVLGIIGFSVVRGAQKGFVWQLASIAAIILCFAFAESLSLSLAPYISVEAPLNRWIAMLILYLLFSFGAFAVAHLVRGWIEKARFVEYDRHLGAVFGLVKGVTFCLVATFFLVTLSEDARAHILESRSGFSAALIMDRLHPVMPDELHDVLEPYIHQLDRPDLPLRHTHDRHADGESQKSDDHSVDGSGSIHGPDNIEREVQPGATAPLLLEISGFYSDFPDARATIVEEIEASLSGIPDQVVFAVLADWRADLAELAPDPDPQTAVATPLDARIVRQLSRAGISAATLSSDLQNRLREIRSR